MTLAPRRRWRYWLRSLRFRVFLVALIVAVAPLSVVAIVGTLEIRSEPEMKRAADRAASDLIEQLLRDPDARVHPATNVERIADRHRVHLRLVDPTGAIVADADATRTVTLVEDLLFGTPDDPALAEADAAQPALMERPIVTEARSRGYAHGCETWASGTLRVCQAGRVLRRGDEVLGLVYAQQAHRRTIRALYDLRFALLKLTLFVAAGALGLGWWLGWRMVRPLHWLRRQALDQVQGISPGGLRLAREDEVGEVAAAFNRLLETLHARARHNEAFVADLAHEFKNPVAAVQACAESLASSGDEPLPPARIQRLARVLRDSSRRLDTLVTQFLELARAEAGMVDEEREPVELGVLVAGVVDAMAAQDEHRAVSMTHEVEPLVIPGIAGRLETAVRNLVHNAASFAGEGGRVRVRLRVFEQYARLEVEDDGPGIALEDQPKVFERFFSRRQGRRGTGLGLALVRAIAQGHGGRASVRSTPGEGSTFVLDLPLTGDGRSLA